MADGITGILKEHLILGCYVVGFYLRGKKQGQFKTFDLLGKVIKIENYFDGLKHGVSNVYAPKTNDPLETYISNSELYINGFKMEQKIFYESGKLWTHSKFANNQFNGLETEYYENGSILRTCNYINGKAEGESIYYHQNGVIEKKIYYLNGWIERRNVEEFHDNGRLARVINWYNDPDQTGIHHDFYPDGQPKYTSNYINGVIEGEVLEYHDNGNIKLSGTYVNGKKHGTFTKYFKNGRVQQVSNYDMNKLSGEFKKFNHRNGGVIANYRHVNGRRQQEEDE